MKKIALAITLVVAALAFLMTSLGLSISNLRSNLDVGVGITAKLGCSGRYISGFAPQSIVDDLRTYSDVVSVFTVRWDDTQRTTTASLLGFNPISATYRPGLGCTLDIGNTSHLNGIAVAPPQSSTQIEANPNKDIAVLLEEILAEDATSGHDTRALLVVQDGHLVAETYATSTDAGTQHLGWSMGKSVTSLFVGHLVMRNLLEIDQADLFTEWRNDERRDISLRQLLQMSSGLKFDETYAPGSDATRMLFSTYDTHAVARDQTLLHSPGRHFSYSSGTTALLSKLIVETLGGPERTFNYIYSQLLHPMGINTLVLEPDPSGVFVGSSYAYGTARDWARVGLVYLNQGSLDGVQVTMPEWIHASLQPNSSENSPAYGYQLWLNYGSPSPRYPDLPKDAYSMQGNRGQVVMMIPGLNTVIVRLGWSPSRYPTNSNFARIIGAL